MPEPSDLAAAVAAAPGTPNSVSTMAPSWSASAASTSACSDAGAVPSPQAAAASPIRAAAKVSWTVCRMDARLLSKSRTSICTPSGTDAGLGVMLSGDARPARMAVMGLVLEGRAAPRTIAGRGREAAAAFRAESGIGFGAGTVGGACGMRDAGSGKRACTGHAPRISHPASRRIGAKRSQGFRGVLGFQVVVIRVRELAGRAIELDLFQGAERDRPGREIIIGIVSFVYASR